jgi:hypothetical protein
MIDNELIEIAREFREGILDGDEPSGRCAMVAWPLEGYLAFLGVNIRAVKCEYPHDHIMSWDWANHVWLELEDGRVLDPTADQFDIGLPAIYLGPRDPRIHLIVSSQ